MINILTTHTYMPENRCLVLPTSGFDADTFPSLASKIIEAMGMTLIEAQQDSDIHLWLVDFEGTTLLLKGEHYSQSCWLEALSSKDNDVLGFLASWLENNPAICQQS